MTNITPSFNLIVSDLRIWVHLGCGEEEKFHPQLVSINLEFNFNAPPAAMITDNLEDTVCYLKAAEAIQSLCRDKRFNLIERLAYDIHRVVSHMVADRAETISFVKVSLHKVAPPVPGVHGGVKAVYSAPIAINEK